MELGYSVLLKGSHGQVNNAACAIKMLIENILAHIFSSFFSTYWPNAQLLPATVDFAQRDWLTPKRVQGQ